MLAVIGVLLLLAIVAGAGWWFLSRPTVPDWDRAASIDLVAPAGDAFDDTTPWVSLTFAPGAIDADVPLTLRVQSRLGTPTPADSGGSAVAAAKIEVGLSGLEVDPLQHFFSIMANLTATNRVVD